MSSIFHDYDIRGRYPDQINEDVFGRLGLAVKQVLKSKKIAIARDGRLSSDTLFLYLSSVLAPAGVKIFDLGRVSSPFCFWYSQKYKTDALMITASHNPVFENGLKIYSFKTGPVDRQSGLLKIKQKYEAMPAVSVTAVLKHKNIKKVDARAEYQKFVLSTAKKISPKVKLAIDFSNSVAAPEMVSVLEKLKLNFVTLNERISGNFPGHSPNPLEESSQKGIRALMKSKKFNLGAVVDGDDDRLVFFDETGETIDPSFITCLMLEHGFWPKNAGVVKTVSLGRIVDEVARARHFKVYVSPVGRSHVFRLIKKKKAVLGAEKSGHYFFKDFYYGDSALAALILVLKILSRGPEPLSRLVKPYQKYIILPEINLPFQGRVDHIIKILKEKFKNGKISELDGLKIDYPDWGFNLRKSNTENLWRLALEGLDKAEVEKRKEEIEEILN